MMTVSEWFLSLSPKLRITSPYGWRIHPITGERHFHYGIDIAGEPEGFPTPTPSLALITRSATSASYGNYVRYMQVGANYEILVAHLKERNVTEGEYVPAGYNIGGMGKTGEATGTHWHIEVRINDVRHDPATVPMYFPPVTPIDRLPYSSRRIIHRRHAHKGRR